MQNVPLKDVLYLLSIIFLISCTSINQKKTPVTESVLIENYRELVSSLYKQCVVTVDHLNQKIEFFIQHVNEDNFYELRQQWINSKQCYSMAEATRFSGTYIDEIDTLINAWPIDELYIDYTLTKPKSGIIGNEQINITQSNLFKLNEQQGETNISIGYHAIEFLLWGQDFNADGPGERLWTDYSERTDAKRRKTYLITIGALLQSHMNDLLFEWESNPNQLQNIDQIISGLGTFIKAELVGERMQVALDTFDQEDEQSCFSDQTNNDIISNIKGVLSVLTGHLNLKNQSHFVKEPGLIDLFRQKDYDLSEKLLIDINQALDLMKQLTLPFDQAILPTNPSQRKIIEDVANLMSLVAKNLRILQYK
jgi:putative iron-regulated protein